MKGLQFKDLSYKRTNILQILILRRKWKVKVYRQKDEEKWDRKGPQDENVLYILACFLSFYI